MNWRELFSYNPATGFLTWKISRSNRIKVGQVAGAVQTNHKGKSYERQYLHVRLAEGTFFVHRIIWEMVTGHVPPQQIDHRDGDGTNNRWDNLRLASRSQNMGNRRPTKSRILPKGVRWHSKGKIYEARLAGKTVKYSKSIQEAKDAYDAAAKAHYGAFARV